MAVPQSAAELFDTILPPKITASPDKAREINAIYQFKITGDGGGEWNVDLSSAGPAITKGRRRSSPQRLIGNVSRRLAGMAPKGNRVKGDPAVQACALTSIAPSPPWPCCR